MKRNHILLGVFALGTLFSSCNFLDKMPDSRTELNRGDKIERLLVTAYPTLMPMGFVEHRTDNVEDNGPRYEDSNLENHEGSTGSPIVGRTGIRRPTSGAPAMMRS